MRNGVFHRFSGKPVGTWRKRRKLFPFRCGLLLVGGRKEFRLRGNFGNPFTSLAPSAPPVLAKHVALLRVFGLPRDSALNKRSLAGNAQQFPNRIELRSGREDQRAG